MFRSIRSRLVASYAALALLGVSLMGVLAVVFVRGHVVRQEREFLLANATADELGLDAAAKRFGRGAFLDRAIPALFAAPVYFFYLLLLP